MSVSIANREMAWKTENGVFINASVRDKIEIVNGNGSGFHLYMNGKLVVRVTYLLSLMYFNMKDGKIAIFKSGEIDRLVPSKVEQKNMHSRPGKWWKKLVPQFDALK